MKNSILQMITILVLLTNVGYGQYFEGKITYGNVFKNKMKNFTDVELELMVGTYQKYFIKGGNYKSFTN